MRLTRATIAASILVLSILASPVLVTVSAQLNIFSPPTPAEEASPSPSPTETPTPAPTPIPIGSAVQASENVSERIDEIKRTVLSESTVRDIRRRLQDQSNEIAQAETETRRKLSGLPSLDAIADIRSDWQVYLSQVGVWQSELQGYSSRLDAADRELAQELKAWKDLKESIGQTLSGQDRPVPGPSPETREPADESASPSPAAEEPSITLKEVPPAVREKIDQTISDIEKAQDSIADARTEILEIQPGLGKREKRIREIIQLADDEKNAAISNLISRDSPPIWDSESVASQTPGEFSETIAGQFRDTSQYLGQHVVSAVVLGAIGFLIVLVLFRARRRTRDLVAKEPELERALVFFRMPLVSGILFTLFLAGIVFSSMPDLFGSVLTIALLVPGYLILRNVIEKPLVPVLNALLLFYVFDEILILFDAYPFIYRILLSAEMLSAIVLAVWIYRRRAPEVSFISEHRKMVERVRVVVLLCTIPFAISLGANILGFVNLARLVARGILDSAYAGLFIYAFYLVLVSLTVFAIRVRPLSKLKMMETHRALVLSKFSKFLKWLLVVAWVLTALNYVYLASAFGRGISAVLTFDLTLGSFSISLIEILVFLFVVWLAFALSRFIRFVLEEDVYTRVRLKEGVPYAVSTILHYALLLGGFTLAILSLGLDLTKFTILAGAFGVGLGFGLQNIVQNFVSGIILLFERPVKVGDVIERGQQVGDLKRIGLRASVVGTPEGAEIIVPNGVLISEEVTNWTPAEHFRRLDINVGVAYGTAAEKVIELLSEVAREHPGIAAEPEPLVLFIGFGDSALNFQLRVWADNESKWWITRSDIYIGVYNALNEAGIGIPFPQRDLNVRAVGSGVPSDVTGLLEKSEDEERTDD